MNSFQSQFSPVTNHVMYLYETQWPTTVPSIAVRVANLLKALQHYKTAYYFLGPLHPLVEP
jgi:hypothetical protein